MVDRFAVDVSVASAVFGTLPEKKAPVVAGNLSELVRHVLPDIEQAIGKGYGMEEITRLLSEMAGREFKPETVRVTISRARAEARMTTV